MTRLNEPIPTESIEPTQPFQERDFQLNCQLSSNIAQSLVMIPAGMIGAGLGIILFPEHAILSSLLGLMIGVITGLIMSGAVIAYISHSVTPVDANHERKFNKARYRYFFSMLIFFALLIGPYTKDSLNELSSRAQDLIFTIYGLLLLTSTVWFFVNCAIISMWKCPRCHKSFRGYPCRYCRLDRYWIP
ncbi:hypothetical protein Plim_1665 [Planctopirus limnophila DSM 3776]|uniref:Uncharacterized protein n=1 Tax=Planctopirus limnophila (strain ATCC 43296 / DSM 3776 / IFAM 1008 / Mu 290) TaxID=521674 RepID=D5SWZ6_PLAL2|nr:hypothetical protein [Planctopirus limnophila]ADG67496.1 hypothetical protein Plim_1665 [Planctopirus limnophila DSM 3776]